jgi:hypothetical protein
MLSQAYYRFLIDLYNTRYNFEMIHGEMDVVVCHLNNGLRIAESLSAIAKSQWDRDVAECTIKTNRLILDTLKGKTGIGDFKRQIQALEKQYPEVFKRGRRDIGTSEEAVRGIMLRLEYAADRYDVRYPYYNSQRSGDR